MAMIIKDAPQPWVQCVLNKIFIKKTETPIPRNADRKAIFTEEVLYIAKLKTLLLLYQLQYRLKIHNK